MKRFFFFYVPFAIALCGAAHAQTQATCSADSLAISDIGYPPGILEQHMRRACAPGNAMRIMAVDAPKFCDYTKSIVQEGRGIVSCVMR